MPKKLNQEDFLKKAREIHGDKYTYERAVYTSSRSPITVTCPEHGEFSLEAGLFLHESMGCRKCGIKSAAEIRNKKAAESFIRKAKEKHKEIYTYDRTVYKTSHESVIVTCRKHGDFNVLATNHLSGVGCPKCARDTTAKARKLTKEEYLSRARIVHQGKYNYANTLYTVLAEEVEIICPIHGAFKQGASNHLSGQGCPKCGRVSSSEKRAKTTEDFVSRANIKHKGRYTYENSTYVSARDVVIITCKEHGPFEMEAQVHLAGGGCQRCARISQAKKQALSQEEFIARAAEKHGGRYSYSETSYTTMKDKLTIICNIHGPFQQTAEHHLIGYGCYKCGRESIGLSSRKATEEFVAEARTAHGDTYNYDKAVYLGSHKKVSVTCNLHGDFMVCANNHIRGKGNCPRCAEAGTSKQEKELADFLLEGNPSWISRTRAIIPPNELDLYLDERKLAVEYCGIYWHSEVYKDPSAHQEKLLAAEKAGVRLITVFEDEWVHNKDVVKAVLARVSGASTLRRVGARQCQTVQLSPKDASAFYLAHHLQGPASANLHLGLTLHDELLAAASFSTPRVIFGGQKTPGEIELVRFCQRSDTVVHGALNKLCAAYASYNPEAEHLISYVDRRWFTGSSYLAAGFSQERITPPGYAYVKGQQRYSRYRFAKHRLAETLSVYDPELTERENMANNGYLRIYDCGQIKMKRPLK